MLRLKCSSNFKSEKVCPPQLIRCLGNTVLSRKSELCRALPHIVLMQVMKYSAGTGQQHYKKYQQSTRIVTNGDRPYELQKARGQSLLYRSGYLPPTCIKGSASVFLNYHTRTKAQCCFFFKKSVFDIHF